MKCKCGKGYASAWDGMCKFCRENKHSRAFAKSVDVRHSGDGMSVEQEIRLLKKRGYMITNYFTFGCGQTFAERHVTITAKTAQRCREIMFNTFGEKWSMQYQENPGNSDHYPTKELMTITESETGSLFTTIHPAEIIVK